MKKLQLLLTIMLAILLSVGLTACSKEPSPPTQEPSNPVQEPSDPVQEPSDPVQEPSDPVQEPSDPVQEPSDPVQEPSDPVQEPSPSQEPSTPSEEPTTPPEEPTPSAAPATIVDITLTGAKTTFAFGETFSSDSLVVTAKLSDGTEKNLSRADYTVASRNFNCMKVGTYRVTVSAADTGISKTYDVTVSPANKLKVLMIGNSYADDAINYAHEIAKSAGIPEENILIADIYIGGCSLATHWDNAQSNAAVYRFGLEQEGWFDGNSYQNWTMEQAIKYADWDFITLQQNSGNSGISSSYACLQNLMDYILNTATNPNVKLVWHQTWAYAQSTANQAFSSYQSNQMTMYNAIASCLQTEVLTKDFAAVIPNGVAIQNARTSFIGDNLTRDGYDHLSEDAGRYIASLGLVGTLTGRDMSTVTWKPTDSGFMFPMSDEILTVCKESWANAMANPDQVTDSKYPPENIFAVFEGKGTKSNPYLIQSADDMRKLSEITRGQSCGDRNTYFKLTANIDLGTESWEPICASAAIGWVETANSFNANFDGNGHTITFVGTYTGDVWAKGLFSAVGGHVHDLTLKGAITTETGRVGSLASMAMAGAKIENVTSYVNITAGNNQIGGIIGYVATPDVTFENCVNYGTITGRELIGGIVGGSWQNVSYINCANHGAITATAKSAGGIAGEKFPQATLTNCSNDGLVMAGGQIATADMGEANAHAGNLIGCKIQ